MAYKIERLLASDYEELVHVLNTAFGRTREDGFEARLPAMWEKSDEQMSKTLVIRENGRIAATVGIHPMEVNVCGDILKFATVGNVATLPEFSGRGMMRELMSFAVKEVEGSDIDVARLGGARQRYAHYGFESAGLEYRYTLTKKNVSAFFGSPLSGKEAFLPRMSFKRLTALDTEELKTVFELYRKRPFFVDRVSPERCLKTLSAWKRRTMLAYDGNEPVGYICVSEDGAFISEICGINASAEIRILEEWVAQGFAESTVFPAAPFQVELNREAGRLSESWGISVTSHFKPLKWERLLSALLKLRSTYSRIPDGGFVIGICGYGSIEFSGAECRRTDRAADLTLSHNDAVRFTVGALPPTMVTEIPRAAEEYINAVFPLPLFWCDQDRV